MSLPARGVKFVVFVAILQVLFIVLMGVFGKYTKTTDITSVMIGKSYPNWQDINVMIFIGFGLLMTFLKNYGYSATGVNMLIAVISIQWSALVIGFMNNDILGGDKFEYGIGEMTSSSFATATVLISFGAVLGKTSPIQLLVMAMLGIFFAQINKYIGHTLFHASDIGESMFLHMFGAYFGMAVARVLYNEDVEKSDKEGSIYHSDIFSIAGTLFLWIYWPSFNGGFGGNQSEIAIVNTFLSLAACAVMTFVVSAILNKGKFDMVHIQNSTLAGGVAVGACANMPMEPYVAMILGAITGPCSVIGYKYISPFFLAKFKLHDTCGVHNLHGIPAWISSIAAAILAATATIDGWGKQHITDIFPEIEIENDEFTGRTPEEQGGYQMAAAVVTMVFAIVAGILTGFVLKFQIWNAPDETSYFDDAHNWVLSEEVPSEPISSKASKTIYETQQI